MKMNDQNARSRGTRRESGLVQHVRASLKRGFARGETPCLLIACSGGRDSVVLVDVLTALVRSGDIKAEIVHIDHRFRDDSSLAAQVVEDFASAVGLPYHLRRLEPDISTRHPGAGLEEALRRERYLAIMDVAAEIDADAVAVGHHQRDQAETVLLHLIRGAGLAGASGMREWSELSMPWWGRVEARQTLRIWRPLLDVSFDLVHRWHHEHHLPLAEDQTNADPIFRRNAIRHAVLPQLEVISSGAVGNLARFAGLAAEDDASLEAIAAEVVADTAGGALERDTLLNIDVSIQRRIVRRWLLESGFVDELSLDRIEAVRELAQRNRSGASVQIGGNWQVRIERGVMTALADKRVP